MAKSDHATKKQVYKEFNAATGQTFKVTGNTMVTTIPMPAPGDDDALGGTSDSDEVSISGLMTLPQRQKLG